MALGWKVVIPLLVFYIGVLGGAVLAFQDAGLSGRSLGLALTGLNVVLAAALLFWLDRGRVIRGSAYASALASAGGAGQQSLPASPSPERGREVLEQGAVKTEE